MTNQLPSDVAVNFERVHLSVPAQSGEKEILHDVEAHVKQGKLITLVGPSGSGKSTLLSLCNLLLTPTSGQVHIYGREVRNWSIPELRQRVGLVFQTPTIFPGTVADNLEIGLKLRGQALNNPAEYLHMVGLPSDILHQNAGELSGGQKQRVALARVLCNQPDILLLDEVTSALDRVSANEVEETILRIHNETHTTVLWVTHHLDQAKRVGDETWLLVDGRIVEKAPTEAFFDHPEQEATRQFISGKLTGGADE